MNESITALSWKELSENLLLESNLINGTNKPQAKTRLFGQSHEKVKVTLYRDYHAWCPYCQKVWIWLELKKIPYLIKKVTMRCYGKKENWYLEKVPSGMLPAIEIDGRVITESDQILIHLEETYGPLGRSLKDPYVMDFRKLERDLFRAWCMWLCNPAFNESTENRRKNNFFEVANVLNEELSKNNSYFLDCWTTEGKLLYPGSADVIFIPYLERMNASLAYYKGFLIRENFTSIDEWFNSLEKLDEYVGTQGDFHTHAHDLPPQMGGCWKIKSVAQETLSSQIDSGEGLGKLETSVQATKNYPPELVALTRVYKHKKTIIEINPMKSDLFDQPLRAALTNMIKGTNCIPLEGSAQGLRYLKDRISVPRDMPLLAARTFRQALERTAGLDSNLKGEAIPTKNRFDQNPMPFIET